MRTQFRLSSIASALFVTVAGIAAVGVTAQQGVLRGGTAAPPAGLPADLTAGEKASPTDHYFRAGGRGEQQVPLRPSVSMLSVRMAAGLDADAARRVLAGHAGVDSVSLDGVSFTERNSAYIPLLPGLSENDLRTVARAVAADPQVVYAEPVYFHETERFGGTNRFIVKFADHLTTAEVDGLLAGVGASVVKSLASGPNTFVAQLPKESPLNAVEVSNLLLEGFRDVVDYANPDFVVDRVPTYTPNDPLYTSQWHLNSTGQSGAKVNADVDAPQAWDVTQGSTSTIIAIIDTGMDLVHQDLTYVTGWNAVANNNNPTAGSGENHATACAGVAAAKGSNGIGVTGACPNCKVMPIRLIVSGATIADEAESFNFAWQNGAHIISNSWGPVGSVATLPSSTKAAIDAATTSGRGGKGCVVVFAAGNDNKNVDANGYAAYSRVIAVAASTDQDLKSWYSNFGSTLEVCAPSNGGVTSGITTTDRTGSVGYSTSNYTSTFGGTSSACPLVAGVAGLMVSINPNLTYTQVRTHLINTATKIDTAGGGYVNGYSTKYGYGKVNAYNAVLAAQGTTPPPPPPTTTLNFSSTNVPLSIPDNNTTGIASVLSVSAVTGTVVDVNLSCNITHTYKGDLQVSLVHPDGTTVILHNQSGGSTDNVITTFDTLTAPAQSLTVLNGKNPNGTWQLRVKDLAAVDVGTLNSWTLQIVKQ